MTEEQLGKFKKEIDFAGILKNYTDALNERIHLAEVYYNTGELDYDLQYLLEWMKNENLTRFTTGCVFYESDDKDYVKMSKSLMKIVDALQDIKSHEFKNTTTDFPETGIIHEGCKLSIVFGQGLVYCIEIIQN